MVDDARAGSASTGAVATEDAGTTARPPVATSPAPATARRPEHPGRGPVATFLPWVVAALALALAGALFLQLRAAGTPEAELAAVEEAAGRFALDLTSWDASDGMGDTREALRGAASERFATEVDELFGGTGDLAELEELGARSEAEVEDVLVSSIEGDEAEALAVVVQRVTTDVTDGEEVSLRYARLGLVEQQGDWRVDRVELVVDALQEAAARTPGAELPGELDLGEDPASDDAPAEEDAS
jgi:hypothetical protein